LLDSAVRVVILPNWQSLVDVAERNEHRLVEQVVAQSPWKFSMKALRCSLRRHPAGVAA
jgi:hypothetical protein